MTEKLKQIIKEETVKLPKGAQGVISTFGWGNISEEIGKKYLLNESETNDLQVQTLLVLIGLENLSDYALNIENEIGTSKGEAEKIAKEINQKIFDPIAEAIVKKVEENLKTKKQNWKQNLNFVLSGGDYSVFINQNSPLEEYPLGGGGQIIHPAPTLDRSTPQEGNNKVQ